MINNVEYLFMYLLAICMFSSEISIQVLCSFYFPFWLHPHRMEVHRPEIESELELRPTSQLWKTMILNPLHQARDRTGNSTETSWIINPLCHRGRTTLLFLKIGLFGGFLMSNCINSFIFVDINYLSDILFASILFHSVDCLLVGSILH